MITFLACAALAEVLTRINGAHFSNGLASQKMRPCRTADCCALVIASEIEAGEPPERLMRFFASMGQNGFTACRPHRGHSSDNQPSFGWKIEKKLGDRYAIADPRSSSCNCCSCHLL